MTAFPQQQHLQLLQPQVPKSINDNFSSIFLSKFVNAEFVQKLSSLLLYQSDLSGSLNVKSVEVVKFVGQFLYSVNKDVKSLSTNVFSVPNTVVQSYLNVAKRILDLRDSVSSRLVTYDNILSHFPKRDVTTDKFLHSIASNQINNISDFRSTLDYTLQVMQAYNELREVRKTVSQWLLFTESVTKDDISIFNTLKEYKETIIEAYNNLSALQVLVKEQSLSDYIVLSDAESIKKVSADIVTFLETGFSFFKSGYPLIDENVGGIESGSVSIIAGPCYKRWTSNFVNCWNILKSSFNHNIVGNNKCDGLKMNEIGQSAAKSLINAM